LTCDVVLPASGTELPDDYEVWVVVDLGTQSDSQAYPDPTTE